MYILYVHCTSNLFRSSCVTCVAVASLIVRWYSTCLELQNQTIKTRLDVHVTCTAQQPQTTQVHENCNG